MKNSIIILAVLIINNIAIFSQGQNFGGVGTNKAIEQIQYLTNDNIIQNQTRYNVANNYVLLKQFGDQNRAYIKQKSSNCEIGNKSYGFQVGNANELSVEQSGVGNILLSSQLGYLSDRIYSSQNFKNGHDYKEWILLRNNENENGYYVEGERNKMSFKQNGDNNSINAIQQGSDNFISSLQIGNYNSLLIMQKGIHNKILDFKQENNSVQLQLDKIIQLGENNCLQTDGSANRGTGGNTFTQQGTNLVLELNNQFLNTSGGIEINQKGTEMKVVINQSFFSYPMK